MAYTKQTWIDGTSIANEDTLNHIEDGIYNNSLDIENNSRDIEDNTTDIINNTQSIDNLNGTLLWTNPNSTATFTQQTISLDLTNYDYIEVWYRIAPDGGIGSLKVKKNTGNISMLNFTWLAGNYGGDCLLKRTIRVTDNSVYFSMAHALGVAANSASTQYDAVMVPAYIVGYKTDIFN